MIVQSSILVFQVRIPDEAECLRSCSGTFRLTSFLSSVVELFASYLPARLLLYCVAVFEFLDHSLQFFTVDNTAITFYMHLCEHQQFFLCSLMN